MASSGNVAQGLLLWFLDIVTFSASKFELDHVGDKWIELRVHVLAPLLRLAVTLCMIMSVMLLVEKLFMGCISLYAKIFKCRPNRIYEWKPIQSDEELGNLVYPMVLVQVPMYNERQVYKLSIEAACRLQWPLDRLIVQVLDDSTDPEIKELVEGECKKWKNGGVNIKYAIRNNRSGYKAGALKEGMKHDYVQHCDYVAIFDADFQPDSDFLIQIIPFLVHNQDIGLVQARWKFVNANECLMTRLQEMSMDYHFKVEQESGSTLCKLFGFNGTAGVWRISAINEAGGWKDRTTVEDMDLAVRAALSNWKFIYVGNIKVSSELPSTFKAYRNQQYRWSCGPANLFRKMSMEILRAKKVSLWKKIHLIYNFFLVRRIIAHIVTFTFYCVVIPTSVLIPEVTVPKWGVVFIPTTITLLNLVGTPRSFYLFVFWILFENVMSMLRTKAVITGILEVGQVNEWVVTEKLGTAPNGNTQKLSDKNSAEKSQKKISKRFFYSELGMAIYLFACACYDFKYGNNYFYFYIYPQSVAFFIISLGYVGTFVRP